MKRLYIMMTIIFMGTLNFMGQGLNESFSGTTFPPNGWVKFRGTNGLGTVQDWIRYTINPYSAPACALVNYEVVSGGLAEDWLVTPKLTVSSGNNTLTFWIRDGFTVNYGSTLYIKVSTASQTVHADFTDIASFPEPGTTYVQKTIDLSSYNGQNIYIAFVWVNNDGDRLYLDNVAGPPVTPCDAYSLPYNENFDAVTAPAIPNCMAVLNGNNDANQWTTLAIYANSAPNCMYIGYNSSIAMDDWFFSPPLTLAAGTYKVSFWYRNNAYFPEALEVKWGSSPNSSGMTNGPIFDDPEIATDVYIEGAGYMVVTSAGDYYVGWHGYSEADMDILLVDDISITQMLEHDVAALSIDLNELVPAGTLSPEATVMNAGLNTETFDVTLTIGTYSSTQHVVALGSDLTRQVTFDPWNAAVGDYTATLTTNLTGDEFAENNSINQAVKVMTINKEVYGYNAFTNTGTDLEGPTRFNLAAPGVLNSITDQSALNFVAGGTWANGIWYGNVYTDNTLISIDPVSGARTVVGSLGFELFGISYNILDGIMYGIDATSLYTINVTTGTATLVGSNTGITMVNLAINDEGEAYSIDLTSDVLGTIDLGTGLFTPIGSIGFDANYAQDMEFDRESGNLYVAAHDNSKGWLALADLSTGNTLKIGDFEGGAEITGFAIPYCIGANTWTGTTSNNWNDPRNWTCGIVPDLAVSVIIPSAPAGGVFPVIASGINAVCYDITLVLPATLTVQDGGTLTVKNP